MEILTVPKRTVYFGDCDCGCAFRASASEVRPRPWWKRWLNSVYEAEATCPSCRRTIPMSKHHELDWKQLKLPQGGSGTAKPKPLGPVGE